MLDIFSKSKVRSLAEADLPPLQEAPGLKEAWRVVRAIDNALKIANIEKAALQQKIENATARSAVTLGNGNDEYLGREMLDTVHLNSFDAQIRVGDKDVVRLDQNINCYKIVRATMLEAFPEISQQMDRSSGL